MRLMQLALALMLVAAPLRALADGDEQKRSLRQGTVELGLCGLLNSVEGSVQARIGLRGGTFMNAPEGLWGAEAEASYATVRSLHQLDLEGNLSWVLPTGAEGLYGFFAIGSGVRLEALGSYRQTLVPVGASIGVRILASPSAGFRLDFKVRRVLNDPVKDFTEVNLAVGISLFL